jgi:hypothetical protein
VQIEPVVRYVVAVEHDLDSDTLLSLARDCRRMGKQEAIYVRLANGRATFVTADTPVVLPVAD